MSWAAAIPAGLNAISSIAGAFGGGEKRPKASEAVKYLIGTKFDKNGNYISWSDAQAIHERNMLTKRMKSAKSLGIHPLMAIGMPTSGTPSVPVSTPSADNSLERFASAGADISRAVVAGASNMERLQERLLEAQIEGQEIDNVMRASQARTAYGQPGTAAGLPGVEVIPKEVVANTGTLEKGIRAIGQRFEFAGSPIYGMSEDFANAGNDDGPLNWVNQLATMVQMGGALLGAGFRKLRSRATRPGKRNYSRNPYRM